MRQRKREAEWKKFYGLEEESQGTETPAARKPGKGEGAMIPSPGTAVALFADCQYPTNEETDRAEAVNE